MTPLTKLGTPDLLERSMCHCCIRCNFGWQGIFPVQLFPGTSPHQRHKSSFLSDTYEMYTRVVQYLCLSCPGTHVVTVSRFEDIWLKKHELPRPHKSRGQLSVSSWMLIQNEDFQKCIAQKPQGMSGTQGVWQMHGNIYLNCVHHSLWSVTN